MKLLKTFAILLISSVAVALPTSVDTTEIDLVQDLDFVDLNAHSINKANQALQTLDRRWNPALCHKVGRTLLTIGTSQLK